MKKITIELKENTYNFLKANACHLSQSLKSYLEGFLENRVAQCQDLVAVVKKNKETPIACETDDTGAIDFKKSINNYIGTVTENTEFSEGGWDGVWIDGGES